MVAIDRTPLVERDAVNVVRVKVDFNPIGSCLCANRTPLLCPCDCFVGSVAGLNRGDGLAICDVGMNVISDDDVVSHLDLPLSLFSVYIIAYFDLFVKGFFKIFLIFFKG